MKNDANVATSIPTPLLDRSTRLAARKRVIGIWKGHIKEMIKENKEVRKEWGVRAKK